MSQLDDTILDALTRYFPKGFCTGRTRMGCHGRRC